MTDAITAKLIEELERLERVLPDLRKNGWRAVFGDRCWDSAEAVLTAIAQHRRALALDGQERTREVPTCCVTGRIAGDADACGDCDPCIMGANAVPAPVKALLKERDLWRDKYSEAAETLDGQKQPDKAWAEKLYHFMLSEFADIPTSGESVTAEARPHFNALCDFIASQEAALDGQEGEVEKRLRDRLGEDHARGCEGRHYTCSCGFDSETDALVTKAADAIAQLRAERDEARQSAKVRLHSIQTHADKHSEACAALTAAESELTKAKAEMAERAALVIEGWSTATNYIPADMSLSKLAGWLADRDFEMAKAVRARLTPEKAQT